jgi:uncharacterized protein (TIGR02246 family)
MFAIPVLVVGLSVSAFAEERPTGVAGEVWAADVEFDRASDTADLELFASLVAVDAVFLGSGGVLEGREAIVAAWSPLFAADRETVLRWQPHTVEVAASGDLAYTIGDYQSSTTLPDGSIARVAGTYVSIWKRGEDGKWRVVVDSGTPPESD